MSRLQRCTSVITGHDDEAEDEEEGGENQHLLPRYPHYPRGAVIKKRNDLFKPLLLYHLVGLYRPAIYQINGNLLRISLSFADLR